MSPNPRPLAWLVPALVVSLLLGTGARADEGSESTPRVADVADVVVHTMPATLHRSGAFPRFYRRYAGVDGITILASERPAEAALQEAAWILRNMLVRRPDVCATLRARGIRCCVMAHDELTTAVPEHASLTPAKWWDYRARGLGPGQRRSVLSSGEENLLGYAGDPYAGESVFVHEFAHAIDLEALRHLDREFEPRLTQTYAAAMKAGLWQGCYAATNREEYWAEGVQSYFDANRGVDAVHNGVDTREKLAGHDPALHALIDEMFGANPWRYVPVAQRRGQGHLTGFDAAKAPTFRWPEGLAAWYWDYERKKATGEGRIELPALPVSPPRSPHTLSETRILFVNETGQTVVVQWLGYDGSRRVYGTLRAGANAEYATLTRHLWLITDEAGVEIARFRAGETAGRAVIRPRASLK
ncbi:MAG: hypothetical protein O2894_12120 [Planctomycetota bacterium]|nr:hypothetical protein [Planctomycetota bacterium]